MRTDLDLGLTIGTLRVGIDESRTKPAWPDDVVSQLTDDHWPEKHVGDFTPQTQELRFLWSFLRLKTIGAAPLRAMALGQSDGLYLDSQFYARKIVNHSPETKAEFSYLSDIALGKISAVVPITKLDASGYEKPELTKAMQYAFGTLTEQADIERERLRQLDADKKDAEQKRLVIDPIVVRGEPFDPETITQAVTDTPTIVIAVGLIIALLL